MGKFIYRWMLIAPPPAIWLDQDACGEVGLGWGKGRGKKEEMEENGWGEQRPTSTWGLGEGRDGEGILKILRCLLKICTVQAESSLHFPQCRRLITDQ